MSEDQANTSDDVIPLPPKETYHTAYVPLEDIFIKTGSSAFTELSRGKKTDDSEKNLVFITHATYERLHSARGKENKKINSLFNKLNNYMQDRSYPTFHSEEYTRIELPEGLDIVVSKQPETKVKNKQFTPLVDRLKEEYSIKDDVKFISSSSKKTSRLLLENLVVEEPEWAILDRRVMEKGIIAITTPELQATLQQNGDSLPYDNVKKYFNPGTISQNVLVHFPATDKDHDGKWDQYAIFRGKTKRDRHGKIIDNDDLSSLTLDMIDQKDRSISIGGRKFGQKFHGVAPRDSRQYIMLTEGLLNPDISSIIITGKAGSGKTLFALLAALDQTLVYTTQELEKRRMSNPFGVQASKTVASNLEDNLHIGDKASRNKGAQIYERLLLLKPTTHADEDDLGFLPGNLKEKLAPILEPYNDAHKLTNFSYHFSFDDLMLPDSERSDKKKNNDPKKAIFGILTEKELFTPTYAGYLRGRSLENTIFIVDEAQNNKPEVIKMIYERAGRGSKVIVLGDPSQTDNRDVSANNNGLVYLTSKLKDKSYSMLIDLDQVYRSELAEEASRWDP